MTMTPPAPPRKNAVAYAENELGVHAAYVEAKLARDGFDSTLTSLAEKKDLRKALEQQIADREADVWSEEYGKHPEMSQAAMERHLKIVLNKDTQLREIRSRLSNVVSDIEGLEFDIRVFETDIRIAVARMNELGGYLEYLAAVKQARTNPRSQEKPE